MEGAPPPVIQPPAGRPPRCRSLRRRLALVGLVLVLAYLALAYFLLPELWIFYAHRHPTLDEVPRITRMGDDHPGDPLNVALVGTEIELNAALLSAGWYPADRLTLRSCWEIASATVRKRSYDRAPVSSEYLWKRKQDLAFEKPVGKDPRQRHHVRFWRDPVEAPDGRPVWVGAAIYDKKVEISRTTLEFTHQTAPDVDMERDYLFHDLQATGELAEVYFVDDFHRIREGRNGSGDRWFTDGRLEVGVLAPKTND
jgi:hypothetical protein